MARICIPDQEYKERVQRCAAILRREKLDALIVNGNEADYANPRYFSGFWPLFERAGVAISAGGDAALMVGPESREFGADRNKLDKIFCLKAYREGADPSYPELQADTFQDVFKAIGVTGQKLRIGIASFLDTSMTIYQAICDAFPGAEPFRRRAGKPILRVIPDHRNHRAVRPAGARPVRAVKAGGLHIKVQVFHCFPSIMSFTNCAQRSG